MARRGGRCMKAIAKAGLVAIAAGLLAFPTALGVAVVSEAHRGLVLPDPGGTYGVGRRIYAWKRTRAGAPGAPRDLTVVVWYPAMAGGPVRPAPYLPPAWTRATGMMGPNLKLQDWSRIATHSRESAPSAPAPGGGFPLVVLLPGYTGTPFDYTVLAESLASRGYVVAGVTPGCCARVSVDADGRVTTPSRGRPLSDADERQVNTLAAQEADEVRDSLAHLGALNSDPRDPLRGTLDLSRLALVGHSLGGTASLQICAIEARCRAAVNLDGGPAGAVTRTGLPKPLLILRREQRPAPWLYLALTHQSRQELATVQAKEDRDDSFLVHSSPAGELAVIAGAGHGDFTDLAILSPSAGRSIGLLGPVDGRAALRTTVARVSTFLAAHL